MTTEQIIRMSDLQNLIPRKAEIQFRRKKGQTQKWFLEIEVTIKPPLSDKEHDETVKKIIDFYGEDLIEVYTEETGHWFYPMITPARVIPYLLVLIMLCYCP